MGCKKTSAFHFPAIMRICSGKPFFQKYPGRVMMNQGITILNQQGELEKEKTGVEPPSFINHP